MLCTVTVLICSLVLSQHVTLWMLLLPDRHKLSMEIRSEEDENMKV